MQQYSVNKLRHSRARTGLLSLLAAGTLALASAGGVLIEPNPAAASPTAEAGLLVPMSSRLLDTRQTTPLSPGVSRLVQATGQQGIPSSGVTALAVTITAVAPTTTGWVWGAAEGAAPPNVSMLNYGPGFGVEGTVSNSAVIAVNPSTGRIQLRAQTSVHVLIDIQGYYTSGAAVGAGGFVSVPMQRLADTRTTGSGLPFGRVAPGTTSTVVVGGTGEVPLGASAAFVNVTVLSYASTDKGFLQAFAAGAAPPPTSLNYQPNATTAIGSTVKLSSDGKFSIKLSNTSSTTPVDIIVDLEGYFTSSTSGGAFTPLSTRVFDGRSPVRPVPANGYLTVQVGGVSGVPSTGIGAVAANILAIAGDDHGWVGAYPSNQVYRWVSTVNFEPQETRGNLAVVKLGPTGALTFRNASASPVTLVVDVLGWFQQAGPDPTESTASTVSSAVPADAKTEDIPLETGGDEFTATSTTSGSIVAPAIASDSIVSTGAIQDGLASTIGVSTGSLSTASGTLAQDGSVVYEDGAVDRSVQATADGFRLHTVIHSAEAPTEFVHDVDLPSGTRLAFASDVPRDAEDPGELDPGAENAVFILNSDNDFVGGFGLPWATDAAGNPVPTHFELRGGDLVQVVSHRTAGVTYPVVADPYLGRAMIKSAAWKFHSGDGWTLEVTPTGWSRSFAGAYLAGVYGWRELYAKYKNQGLNTNLGGMRDQYICHQQIVAVRTPRKATWNIDEWRPDVSYLQTINASCNPGGSRIFD